MSEFDIQKQPDSGAVDYVLKFLIIAFSPVPFIPEIISEIVKHPVEQRYKEWFQSLAEGLTALRKEFDDLSPENLSKNERFITAVMQLTRTAIDNHEKDRHEKLRNAVLNSALPHAPDDIRQKLFNRWLDELTPWHWKVLALFDHPRMSELDLFLKDNEWKINIALDKAATLIENTHPEMKGQFHLYVQIIDDLHSRGLIANNLPEKGMAAEMSNSPKLTPLARDFLKYIKSPLDEP